MIIGTTGSGKTTLAGQVAERHGHDFIDLDTLHWLPGWQERNPEDFLALVDTATQKATWVISGNYRIARPLIWQRADMVAYLDYSTRRILWQLSRRSFHRAWTKTPICNGNIETWKKLFSSDSIFVWFFKSHWKRRREIRGLLDKPQDYPHITFVRFKTPKETSRWLNQPISSLP